MHFTTKINEILKIVVYGTAIKDFVEDNCAGRTSKAVPNVRNSV